MHAVQVWLVRSASRIATHAIMKRSTSATTSAGKVSGMRTVLRLMAEREIYSHFCFASTHFHFSGDRLQYTYSSLFSRTACILSASRVAASAHAVNTSEMSAVATKNCTRLAELRRLDGRESRMCMIRALTEVDGSCIGRLSERNGRPSMNAALYTAAEIWSLVFSN